MKKIILHGCYDIRNFGDQLIMEVVKEKMCHFFEDYEVIVPIRNRKNDPCWFFQFFKCSLCVFGGGGYLSDFGCGFSNFKQQLKYIIPVIILRMRGIPYVIINPGVGPVKSNVTKFSVKTMVSGARYVSVRDHDSAKCLREIGCKNQIETSFDCVFAMTKSVENSTENLKPIGLQNNVCGMKVLGIHLHSVANLDYAVFEQIMTQIFEYAKRDRSIELVLFSDHGSENTKCYESFLNGYGDDLPLSVIIDATDIGVMKSLMKRIDGVVTSKLHVGIVAFYYGVKTYSLWTHEKTPRFYKQVNRLEFCENYKLYKSAINKFLNDFKLQQSMVGSDTENRLEHLNQETNKSITEAFSKLLSI